MRITQFLFIFSLVSLSVNSFAAEDSTHGNSWRRYAAGERVNFFEMRDSFKKELGNKPYEKGKGIKQFRRWEYYWSKRVNMNGDFPEPGHVISEMETYLLTHPQNNALTASEAWELVGPLDKPANGTGQPNGNGRLNCITFHPTEPATLFVGSPSGGFWKSRDNGASWTQYSTGLARLGVSSIVVDPGNPDLIYLGTGDRDGGDAPGYGVWRSLDGGVTWESRNNGMGNRTVYEILMNPDNPSNMIASTSGSRIYRTTDGGANWSYVSVSSSMKDISFKPGDPDTIYAAGTTFEVSTDNGVSFSRITSGVPSASRIAIAVSAAAPARVYLLCGDGGGFVSLISSSDSGTTFATKSTAPNILGYSASGSSSGGQVWYDHVLAADPQNADIVYAGGINLWKSSNGGSSWQNLTYWASDVHADQHALEFSPHTGVLYAGNDGGIYCSFDDGSSWSEISSGLYIAQVYKIGVAALSEDLVINGYQDNGTAISDEAVFKTTIGGDGMECVIDPLDETYMYGALYYGDIRRSSNHGTSFQSITGTINESGPWVTPYKLDPNDPSRMFVGMLNVWRCDDVRAASPTFKRISNFSGSSKPVDLAIAPSDSDVVYVSRNGSKLHLSTDALANSPAWTDLSLFLPENRTPADIEINPVDPTHLYIALGNNIYESTDSGGSWTDVSGSLPDISLNTILIDRSSLVDALYVGMDVGVYYKDKNLSDWILYAAELPNVEITELEMHYPAAGCPSLFAGTYGQGLWKAPIKSSGIASSPFADFDAPLSVAASAVPVALIDTSCFTPQSWSWTITPNTYAFADGTDATSQNPMVQFTSAGIYSISLTVANSYGADTISKTNCLTATEVFNPENLADDFESYPLASSANDCGDTVCVLTGSKWRNLINYDEDDIDWRVDEGGTPSSGTGPSTDYNPGTATGNYLYTEGSSCFGSTAILESEFIDIAQPLEFSFAYHMQGASMGDLHIDLQQNGVWENDVALPLLGEQGSGWLTNRIDLTPYVGTAVKLRLRGITGSAFTTDMAIDDFRFLWITSLASWLAGYNLELANISEDYDGDGLSVLEEYSFNLDPFAADDHVVYNPDAPVGTGGPRGVPLIYLEDQGNEKRLKIIFPQRKTATENNVEYSGKFSNDLRNWVKLIPTSVVDADDLWEIVTIEDEYTADTAPEGVRFACYAVRLTTPPVKGAFIEVENRVRADKER